MTSDLEVSGAAEEHGVHLSSRLRGFRGGGCRVDRVPTHIPGLGGRGLGHWGRSAAGRGAAEESSGDGIIGGDQVEWNLFDGEFGESFLVIKLDMDSSGFLGGVTEEQRGCNLLGEEGTICSLFGGEHVEADVVIAGG